MKNMETEQMALTQLTQTNWGKLSISNDFMFGKVMQNQELCKELLQRILPDLKIDHIEYPELQKSIKPDMDARSVRLDVYVKDNKEVVYDIEMQVSDTKELPKRSRYYQKWRHEYMTLLMRDQENQRIGEEKMIVNALRSTKSIKKTSVILQISEQEVRKIAKSKNLLVDD